MWQIPQPYETRDGSLADVGEDMLLAQETVGRSTWKPLLPV